MGLTDRKACRYIGLCRATWQYVRKPESAENIALRAKIRALAARWRRFGSPRIWRMLRREGWQVNIKRVVRIYVEEKLSLRLKRRKKQAASARVPLPAPTGPNQTWSMDFVWDWVRSGRRLKMLTIVDDFTRECLAIEVDYGIGGRRVAEVLQRLIEERGKVGVIRSDNGPEFTSNALDAWAWSQGIKLDFIQPGKPNQNAFIESFNGRFREECLNDNQFLTFAEAQVIIESWRKEYNDERPHGSLNGLTPKEFADGHASKAIQSALRAQPILA